MFRSRLSAFAKCELDARIEDHIKRGWRVVARGVDRRMAGGVEMIKYWCVMEGGR